MNATFYVKLCTDPATGTLTRYIGLDLPDDTQIEVTPGRHAKRHLRHAVAGMGYRFRHARTAPVRNSAVYYERTDR